jgi:hypothetical protein
MKYMREGVAVLVFLSVFMTGSVSAETIQECKKKCNDAYSACQKSGKDENKCLAAWVECKKKCTPATQ